MARTTNWQTLSDSDLIEQLDEAKEEVFKLRFQIVTGRLDNTARLKQAKKEVARAMTELRMREIQAAEALEAELQEAGNG
ncbi:MAG: 50S ribosomal protein L29 [Acidimicrobiia bacterium]|nr:50S ribosomal protein L29 [bacterium]MXW58162.1 50S ribosomal protein L29 [Acidimicrobiia bacterium]MXZ79332.1 50S ribosomal protein L29 [Acidimicrobiia bacterium]MXZ85090.1 50S ribosomal protein L29 [Acidimicrobiia bacterium]MYB09060.1 50S ribosomal protein L29 [Acidimicrobiia bacterium]